MLTEEERRQELVDLWTKCTSEVSEAVEEHFDSKNNLAIIVQSGARGNMMQINQIAGMRGLVANPKARSFLDRSSPTTVRACPCWNTSSPSTRA